MKTIGGVHVKANVHWVAKSRWNKIDGSRESAKIVGEIGLMLQQAVAHRVISRGVDHTGRSFGRYAERKNRTGFGVKIAPSYPQPKGYGLYHGGFAYYRSRADYVRLLGNKQARRKFVMSGGMWESWGVYIRSPIEARVRFAKSSRAYRGRTMQNREKARRASHGTGRRSIVAISQEEKNEDPAHVMDSITAAMLNDARAKAAGFRIKRRKGRAGYKKRQIKSLIKLLAK